MSASLDCPIKLFGGALQRMIRGEKCKETVLQLLGKKKICGNSRGDVRYRMLVSDGGHLYSFVMMAPQQNFQISKVPDLSIIRIERYQIRPNKKMYEVQKRLWRPILVIFNLTVLVNGNVLETVIGKPAELVLQIHSAVSCEPAVGGNITISSPKSNQPSPLRENNTILNDISKPNQCTNGDSATMNIAEIMDKHQNGWIIKARAIEKTSLNAFARGHYFNVIFRDNTGDIRAIFWNNCCFKYYDMIMMNKLYNISEFHVKLSNKKFNPTSHPFELHSTDKTLLVPCDKEDTSIPIVARSFMPLHQIFEAERGTFVAVIGVCIDVSEVNIVAGGNQREAKTRKISIVDATKSRVVLTIWGPRVALFDGSDHPVVAVKNGKTADYNGNRSINVLHSSTLLLNPDIPETEELKQWRSGQEFQVMLTDRSTK